MELYKQVCDLGQARRLYQLGITAKACLVFKFDEECTVVINDNDKYPENPQAFSVAELGAMFPINSIISYPTEKGYVCDNVVTLLPTAPRITRKTEAKARAAMLIYWLENNLTNAEEVNLRLNKLNNEPLHQRKRHVLFRTPQGSIRTQN